MQAVFAIILCVSLVPRLIDEPGNKAVYVWARPPS